MFLCRRSVVEILINPSRYSLHILSLLFQSVDVNCELSACPVLLIFFHCLSRIGMWQRSDYMTKYEVHINMLILSCQTEGSGNAEVMLFLMVH